MIAARFADRAAAKPAIELLEGTGFVLEGPLRHQAVGVVEEPDGSVTITLRGSDDAGLVDLLRRVGARVQEVADRPRDEQ